MNPLEVGEAVGQTEGKRDAVRAFNQAPAKRSACLKIQIWPC